MNTPQYGPYIQILLLLAFIIPAILFFLTQQRILEVIGPLNRRMQPVHVWIQLIPIIGQAWQFYVITMISYSIRNELNTPASDSVFADSSISEIRKPAFNAGILYAAMFTACIISPRPLLTIVAFLIGISAWIYYWVQLIRYKKQLKERRL